jgi:hypothetical protein
VFLKSSNAQGIDIILGRSSGLNTLLRLHSSKPGRKEIRNRRHSVYSFPFECGRSYIGETGRPLAVWLHEHRYNLKEGFLEKSKLAQHDYKEGRRFVWGEARILDIESNSRYTKYKESAHMACLTNPINQLCLNISPIWIPLISDEVIKSKRSLGHPRFFIGLYV